MTDRHKKTAFYIISCLIVFLVPVITGIIIFIKKEIAPFGKNDLLSLDLWIQYFPMYRKIALDHGLSESLYDWSGALGFNKWIQSAFYSKSIFLIPLNFLSLESSIVYIDMVCLLRFGLGALACYIFLQYKLRSKNIIIMALSIAYGLCAYSTAFIMQFMWTDGLFLAPLVLLGLERLMKGRSPLMYVITLALAIYTNFYTGFGICLFTAFYFIAGWLRQSPEKIVDEDTDAVTVSKSEKPDATTSRKTEKLLVLGKFALYSLLAGLIPAFVLLPVLKGLAGTESALEKTLDFTEWYHSLAENVAAMLPGTAASMEFGVANIAVGLFVFLLLPLFFFNARIGFRDKLCMGGILAVLYAGLNYNPLDWFFNGFHFANQLPGRWSFLFSLMLVTVCAEGAAKYKGIRFRSIVSATIVGVFFIFYAGYGTEDAEKLAGLANWSMLLLIYAVILVISRELGILTKDGKKKRTLNIASSGIIAVLITFQLCGNVIAVTTVEDGGMPKSEMDPYVKVSTLLGETGKKYSCGKDEFYRAEANGRWTFNTAMIGDFNGIGYYGSTLDHGVYELLRAMGNGVYANNVSTIYNNDSVFQNSLFGVKYIFDRDKNYGIKNSAGYEQIETGEDMYVWENSTAFPIAFAVSDDIYEIQPDMEDIRGISFQNEIINGITDVDSSVYEQISPDSFESTNCEFISGEKWDKNYYDRINESESVRFKWTYTVPDDDPVYIEHNFRAGDLVVNGSEKIDVGRERFKCLGSYPAGTVITIEYEASGIEIGCFGAELYSFDMKKWREVYEDVCTQGLKVTSFRNTRIAGTIDMKESGTVLTTIPQDGGWRVYVDGKKVEDSKALGTLMAFSVPEGEHKIEFRYHVPALVPGVIISLVAVLGVVVCCNYRKIYGELVKMFSTRQEEKELVGHI